MQITKLQKNQLDTVVNIHKTCVSETNSKVYPKPVIQEWLNQINANNIVEQLSNSEWIVAKTNDTLLGFAQYSVEDGYLYQINVLPDFQGQQLGKRLFEYIEKEFKDKGVDEIKLNSTLNAVPFYKKLGFTELEPISFLLDKERLEMISMNKKVTTSTTPPRA
jgi:ribosomal protein S18 acetylase RimI-like enzyme